MTAAFYRAFEDKFRGSRELIKNRLSVYLPFIEPLLSMYPNAKVLDLGCGRGEWLEIAQQHGFDAFGVDLDLGMLAGCSELNLKVALADALQTLKEQPDESIVVVSGFHIVEHIPFEDVQTLVQEAKRVLKPAGLLILETPNAENLEVSTCNFFTDPTHIRPIPPMLLSFVPEYFQFERTKIVRLQEETSFTDFDSITLNNVISGVSRDYAVIAQKTAQPDFLQIFNSIFEQEFGVDLSSLVKKYDEQSKNREQSQLIATKSQEKLIKEIDQSIEKKVNDIRAEIEQNFQKMTDEKTLSVQQMIENNIYQAVQNSSQEIGQILENRIEELDKKIQAEAIGRQEEIRKIIEEMHRQIATRIATDVEQKTQELEKLAHAVDQRSQEAITLIQSANNTAQQAINQLQAVYSSNSWRITAHLRLLKMTIKAVLNFIFKLLKKAIKPIFVLGMKSIYSNLFTKNIALKLLNKAPRAKQHLTLLALRNNIIQISETTDIVIQAMRQKLEITAEEIEMLKNISPIARLIYVDLKELEG